ncbi:S8 family serine peptidase [Mesobacillus foraminis]|uniref:S8 family serine peptidase n=1 Tax=Mesobacillus foraminis TaxID=279826 RepID=UPI001BE7E7A0|nr:S8 family serine peptidase [Mesobacillus foraminis]MBT2756927.1 S8 family serine peptidase [Mesobacillus foraminis]
MRKSKLLSITLVSLLGFSSILPATAGANGESASAEKLRKSEIRPSIQTKKSLAPDLVRKVNPAVAKFRERAGKENRPEAVPGELIITYEKGTSASTKSGVSKQFSLKKEEVLESIHSEVVTIPKGKKVAEYIKELEKDPAIESVQPNYKYYASTAPNYYNQLWGLNNDSTTEPIKGIKGNPDIDINAPEAWSSYKNLKEVVVGVIDTGIDINHPDLKGKIWTNPGESGAKANDGIDNDGNGFIDDVHGWDFYNEDNTVFDAIQGDDHGTHVAGTIAAVLEGGSISKNTGVAGAAPNVKIMPIKFLGPEGGTTAGAVAAIEYAKKMGVKITNNSWGGGEYDPLLEQAIANSDSLFVAAAGNEGMDIDEEYSSYPASFESSNILSVAAVDNLGQLAPFSNYGKHSVDIAAPGVNVLSTVPKFPVEEWEKELKGNIGAAAQVDNKTYGFKAVVDGIGFDRFTDEAEQQEAFTNALNYILPQDTSKPRILLVQDDEHELDSQFKGTEIEGYFKNLLPMYEKLLKKHENTYETVTIDADGSLENKLGNKKLADYDGVIWFTGNGFGMLSDEWTALTAKDVKLLEEYVKGGGNLLLSGQDAVSFLEGTAFVKDLLNLNVFSDLAPHLNVAGTDGSIYSKKDYKINRFDGLFPAADLFQPNGENAKISLKQVSTYDQAYDYYNGTSMAAPHATAAAALFAGLHEGLSPVYSKLYLSDQGKQLESLKGAVGSGKMIKATGLSTFNENSIPGAPMKNLTQTGTLDSSNDRDDVFAISLNEGEGVSLSLSGINGTDFDLYVYDEEAADVKGSVGLVAKSEKPGTSAEKITFTAPKTGFYFINAYSYKGKGSYKLQVGNYQGSYENETRLIGYKGEWDIDSNAKHSGKMASVLNSAGEATFSFVGYSFEWQGFKNAAQGIADVYIDGVKDKTVSLYSPSLKAKQSIYKKEFSSYGKHTVRIIWTGRNDSENGGRKSATTINIDRFVVKSNPASVKAAYHSVKKSPVITWSSVDWADSYNVYRKEKSQSEYTLLKKADKKTLSFTDSKAVPGKTYSYGVTVVTNGSEETPRSTSAAFIFDDDVKGSQAWAGATAKGSLEAGKDRDAQDVWKKKLEKGQVYEILLTGPKNTNFNLKVYQPGTKTIAGAKAAASASAKSSSEKIIFKPAKTGTYYFVPSASKGNGGYTMTMNVQGKKKVESNSSSVKRAGTWAAKKDSKASGGSVLQSKKAKSSVTYKFTGTGISVYASKYKDMGSADIYLDGKKVKTVDLYSSKSLNKQKVYHTQSLSNKSHTLKIVVTGKKRKASTGTYVRVDAFEATHFSPVK